MTADTYSTDGIGVLLMGTGNDNNSWGTSANANVFQYLVDSITNTLTSAVTGGTLDLSGTPPPTASSQVRYAGLIFTGVLTSNQILQIPNLNKWWLVKNATSGAFTLKIKTSGGSASTAIPQNSGWQMVQCDGANGITVWPFNTSQIQMPDGSVSAPAYSNITEPNSGWRRAGTQDWRLVINGLDVLQVTGAGAGSPSIVNAISPNVVQQAGVQIVPPGVEAPYAGITVPSGWYFSAGQSTISRATDANLFAAITATCTGNTHANSTIDNLSTDLRNLGVEGAFIEGTGISLGTTIVTVNSASSITVSPGVSGTNSGVSLRILPYGQGDGSTTFALPDRRGRSIFGRDNMNGTAANRLTGVSGSIAGNKLNGTGGEETHALVTAELASHAHSVFIRDPNHSHNATSGSTGTMHGVTNPGQGFASGSALFFELTNVASGSTGVHTNSNSSGARTSATDDATATAGTGTAHNTVPPGGVSNVIIKR